MRKSKQKTSEMEWNKTYKKVDDGICVMTVESRYKGISAKHDSRFICPSYGIEGIKSELRPIKNLMIT